MNYTNLENCIHQRLDILTERLKLDPNQVKGIYIHNANKILHDMPDFQNHYSKILAKACENTIKFYERHVR